MSEADKMFDELGYDVITKTEYEIVYFNNRTNVEILFDLVDKTVEKYLEGLESYYSMAIDMDESKAINLKVKELGWNE